jgi:Trypsin
MLTTLDNQGRGATRLVVLIALLTGFLVSGNWSPAHAIANGTDAPNTALDRATVYLVDGVTGLQCSGTLVAANLVLTAGHCVNHPQVPITPFRSSFDQERPDRYYPIPAGVAVTVANDLTAPSFQTTSVEYAVPGLADMLLLRLQQPVPATAATPVRIISRVFSTNLRRWLAGLTFRIAGWGNDETGNPVTKLQQGFANRGVFPCPAGSDGWTFGAAHMICVESADGSGTRPGDSGGPLYWTSSSGVRQLLGVFQGMEKVNAGRYTTTFYRGGSNYDRLPYSNLGGWLEQFVSGRTGGAAFLWSDDPSTADRYVPTTYASNPSGLLVHVRHLRTGVYEAALEGLRQGVGGVARVPFVTAYGSGAAHCKLADGSLTDRVQVRCFRASTLTDSQFSLLADASSNDLLLRVPFISSGAVSVPGLDGGAVVTHLGNGLYRVDASAWSRGPWRNVIVTAEGMNTVRCHVEIWWATSARVRCANSLGTLIDSAFTFAATSGRDSSYAFASNPTSPFYTAPALYSNVVSSTALPTIRRDAVGRYTVSFPGAPANAGGNAQATAYGSTANHCKVGFWTATTASVRCFDTAGNAADERFVVRMVDPLDIGRRVSVRLGELRATSRDACGGMDMYGMLRFLAGASGSVQIPRVDNADVRRFSPPITLTALTAPGVRFVDVELAVRDDDDLVCGGDDDAVDIVPNPAALNLRFQIDLQGHTVRMLDSTLPVLGGLGNWWTDGRDGRETGKADFEVSVSAP